MVRTNAKDDSIHSECMDLLNCVFASRLQSASFFGPFAATRYYFLPSKLVYLLAHRHTCDIILDGALFCALTLEKGFAKEHTNDFDTYILSIFQLKSPSRNA